MASENSTAERIVPETVAYVEQVEECVATLPELYARYRDGDPYHERVERVRETESDCDRAQRRLRRLLADATAEELGLLGARFHMNGPRLVELYTQLDAVANRAEEAATELATTTPERVDALFEPLVRLADAAARAVAVLREATVRVVQLLDEPGATGSVAESVRRVRQVESTADEVRNDVVATAFGAADVPRPMLFRALARDLEAVVDAAEDAADQVVVVASAEPGVTVAPDAVDRAGRDGRP